MKASSTPLIVLLAAIAASTTRSGGAISHKPTFNHPSKNVDVTSGLKVDRDGNLYYESSSRATPVRSAPKSKHLWKYTLRGGSSVDDDSSSRGSLQVDAEGNFFFASSARHALNKLRGGELSVDPEGNLYIPRDSLAKPTQASAPPAAKKAAAAAAASPEALRGGSGASPHRLGGLCVDAEGNLYAAPTTDASLIHSALGVRGGALCVDNEGNFYSPRAAETPKPLASNRRGPADNSDPVLLVQHDRKVRPRKAKAKKTGHKKEDENPNAFIGFNNALMET